MYFSKSDVINKRLGKKPRTSYKKTTKTIKIINIILSLFSLIIVLYTANVFIEKISNEREAYLVQSTGEFKLIKYSDKTNNQITKIINERNR